MLNSRRQACFASTATGILTALLLSACGAPAGADDPTVATPVPSTASSPATATPEPRRSSTAGNTDASGASAGKLQDPSQTVPSAGTSGAAPVRISIPAIGVDAPLEVLSLDAENALQPPVAWDAAGWYDRSPVPGERGPSVIAGHLVAPDGPAVFVGLGALGPGDRVTVTQADGSTDTFAVDRTISAERTDSFPTEEIYGPTPDAQLRLITCDGEYDPARGHWTRNMVVFATALR